jgi:hypothetical protein
VAIVLRAWESHAHGEGPQLVGSLVATLLDAKAWEALPMPAERERGGKSKRRGPCAVKVACTVPTGGMERRVARYRALSLPTKAVHGGKGHSLRGGCVVTLLNAKTVSTGRCQENTQAHKYLSGGGRMR